MTNYPTAPSNIASEITEPSSIYKKEVIKSVTAIIMFIIAYLLLISGAAFLASLCVKLGISIIFLGGHFLTLIAGGGIILIGLLIFYFVIKFIFNSYKTDRNNLVEITETEQPQLFEFIHNITQETQAPFPKKIYLSNEVNASVFYDSSFWSMFLPVRKNLLIGLGLVNSVTVSEFKAILAHEFGHFSQKSMKLGNYVYNANRIIHNLLFDNGGFYNTLQTIANVHAILYICMYSVSMIVKGIQYILNQIYIFINKQNLKLSREMEFHADSVAASVAGSMPLITSLYRLELAENSFSNTLNLCDQLLTENKQEKNIYSAHKSIMNTVAKDFQLPFRNDLPSIDKNTMADFDTCRVNIENQWASHPSTEDREKALLNLHIDSQTNNESAWRIFNNADQLQELMTCKVYENAPSKSESIEISNFIEHRFTEQQNHFTLPEYTKGYWDSKLIPEGIDFNAINHEISLSENQYYSNRQVQLGKQLTGLLKDIQVIEAINNKQLDVSSFEFEGNKYNKRFASTILTQLKSEQTKLDAEILETDKKLLLWEYNKATSKNSGDDFLNRYENVIQQQQKRSSFHLQHQAIADEFSPLFQGSNLNIDEARNMVTRVQGKENEIKKMLIELLEENSSNDAFINKNKLKLRSFIESNRTYLTSTQFQDESIRDLFSGLSMIDGSLNELEFAAKRKLFEFHDTNKS